jgi:predicted ATPase
VVRSPLRGRDRELALISERITGALGGRGAVVVVEGQAGLGKTRLIAEAMAIAKDKGLSVGSGVAAAIDQAVPMGPLVAAVVPLVDSKTRSALPYLPEQRYWLLEELEGALETLAMQSPLLLCVDDVQWAIPRS